MTGLEVAFPGLCDTPYQITSPADDNYNCIAWAAGFGGSAVWLGGPHHEAVAKLIGAVRPALGGGDNDLPAFSASATMP